MAKVQLQCPSCGGQVELGDIECAHCGVNLKSGESYEARIKQAKGKALHPEHYTGRIYMGVIVAFALVIFAGYMYQRAVENTIAETTDQGLDFFRYPVLKMQEIDDLVALGNQEAAEGNPAGAQESYNEARQRAQALVDWLGAEVAKIKPEEPWSPSRQYDYRTRMGPEYNRRLARRQLNNLKVKAERKLEQVS